MDIVSTGGDSSTYAAEMAQETSLASERRGIAVEEDLRCLLHALPNCTDAESLSYLKRLALTLKGRLPESSAGHEEADAFLGHEDLSQQRSDFERDWQLPGGAAWRLSGSFGVIIYDEDVPFQVVERRLEPDELHNQRIADHKLDLFYREMLLLKKRSLTIDGQKYLHRFVGFLQITGSTNLPLGFRLIFEATPPLGDLEKFCTLRQELPNNRDTESNALFFCIFLDILRGAVRGLEYLHKQGIVHRDLRPQNVSLNIHEDAFTAKLGNFASAKVIDQKREHTANKGADHRFVAPEVKKVLSNGNDLGGACWSMMATRAKTSIGSEPNDHEQKFMASYSYPADYFSVGMIIQQCGEELFGRDFLAGKPKLAGIVERCLDINPENRFGRLTLRNDSLAKCLDMLGGVHSKQSRREALFVQKLKLLLLKKTSEWDGRST